MLIDLHPHRFFLQDTRYFSYDFAEKLFCEREVPGGGKGGCANFSLSVQTSQYTGTYGTEP